MPEDLPSQIESNMPQKPDFFLRNELMNMESRRFAIYERLNAQERKVWDNNEETFFKAETRVKKSTAVKRLQRLSQFGGLLIAHPEAGYLKNPPREHSRAAHCELCAILARASSAKLGAVAGVEENSKEMMPSFVAAWIHDIGHMALPHWYDRVLETDHEKLSVQKLETDQILSRLLERLGNKAKERIISLVTENEENNPYVHLQSALDTLSYLVIDSEVACRGPKGRGYYEIDQGMSVVNSITGIHKEGVLGGRNVLKVNNIKVWQDLLNNRAEMMKEVYLSPQTRLAQGAMQRFISIALKSEKITVDQRAELLKELKDGDPDSLHGLLLGFVEGNGAPLAEFRDLLLIASGWFGKNISEAPEIPTGPRYKRIEFDPELESEREIRIKIDKILDDNPKAFELRPVDYTKKTLTVYDENSQQVITLRANNVELRPEEKKYIVIILEEVN